VNLRRQRLSVKYRKTFKEEEVIPEMVDYSPATDTRTISQRISLPRMRPWNSSTLMVVIRLINRLFRHSPSKSKVYSAHMEMRDWFVKTDQGISKSVCRQDGAHKGWNNKSCKFPFMGPLRIQIK
jgi:hypothetical protein